MRKIKLKSQPKWIVRMMFGIGAVAGLLLAFTSHPIGGTNAQSIDCPEGQYLATGDVCVTNDKDIVLQATATEANQTLKINKYFANAYTVDRGDGITGSLTADTTHTYNTAGTYNITLSLRGGASRWTFQSNSRKPLVPTNGTTVTGVQITYMPSLADGFGNSATNPGGYFFSSFNYGGSLTSLPEGSFDTSNISGTVGDYFFYSFNERGSLTSLPEGSFNTSNITTVGNSFFSNFNQRGILTSLPEGSFDTSKITTVGNGFFGGFNRYGKLTSLPEGSFDTSNISGTVGDYFFYSFNKNGKLTSLPEGSFDTSNISGTVGDYFFYSFNERGSLTSLPEGSFDTSKITTVGNNFFAYFNYYVGSLTSLPEGSFDTSNISGTVGNNFFAYFNSNYGSLTSLPEGSFDISNITSVGDYFFAYFNGNHGSLTNLPEGSFDISNITSVGDYFFYYFNRYGKLTSLPESFKLNFLAYNKSNSYTDAFNSPYYTLNRKVSDLVSGVTAPDGDRDTFSNNQPGRCGVHKNWLETTANACRIRYDANGGVGSVTGGYASDATSVVAGSNITVPTRNGYSISGWYTDPDGGELVETITFPDMDGNTLYAHRTCSAGTHTEGDACVDNEQQTGCLQIGQIPANSNYNIVNVTGIWDSGTNSRDIPACSWRCADGYTQDGDLCKADCEFNGQTVAHGSSVTAYLENISMCPGSCQSQERTCNDGVLSGSYTSTGCILGGVSCDEGEFSLTSCPDHGICNESCTPYVVNEGSCQSNLTKYKLNGCDEGYHIDNGSCENNIKIEMCKQSWKPSNSIYEMINVQWTWNTGTNFRDVPSCAWSCNTGYTKNIDSCSINQYTITFDTDGGSAISPITGDFGSAIVVPANPTKDGYDFAGWDRVIPNTMPAENIVITALWTAKPAPRPSSGGGGGGGGGTTLRKDNCPGGDFSDSYYDGTCDASSSGATSEGSNKDSSAMPQNDSKASSGATSEGSNKDSSATPQNDGQTPQNDKTGHNSASGFQFDTLKFNPKYSDEMNQAYQYAYHYGITTKDTIRNADVNGKLTRVAMAKMLSQYAINVLGMKPDKTRIKQFDDVSERLDTQYDNGVTLAYQLGIMGINMPNNEFMPNNYVTRAQFVTALSRLLYSMSDGKYEKTSLYYTNHMNKLYNEGIISNTDPTMLERRGYVMLMLMRSENGRE